MKQKQNSGGRGTAKRQMRWFSFYSRWGLIALMLILIVMLILFMNRYPVALETYEASKLLFALTILLPLLQALYLGLVLYTFPRLRRRERLGWILNNLILILLPAIPSLFTVMTHAILDFQGQPNQLSPLSYLLVYLLEFAVFSLPNLIYFYRRRSRFQTPAKQKPSEQSSFSETK